jgi:hypothetical protein
MDSGMAMVLVGGYYYVVDDASVRTNRGRGDLSVGDERIDSVASVQVVEAAKPVDALEAIEDVETTDSDESTDTEFVKAEDMATEKDELEHLAPAPTTSLPIAVVVSSTDGPGAVRTMANVAE